MLVKGEGRPLVEVRGERTTCRDAEGLRGQQSAWEGEMLARKCPGRVSEWVSVVYSPGKAFCGNIDSTHMSL